MPKHTLPPDWEQRQQAADTRNQLDRMLNAARREANRARAIIVEQHRSIVERDTIIDAQRRRITELEFIIAQLDRRFVPSERIGVTK